MLLYVYAHSGQLIQASVLFAIHAHLSFCNLEDNIRPRHSAGGGMPHGRRLSGDQVSFFGTIF